MQGSHIDFKKRVRSSILQVDDNFLQFRVCETNGLVVYLQIPHAEQNHPAKSSFYS